MKKTLAFILALCLCVGLCACDTQANTNDIAPPLSTTPIATTQAPGAILTPGQKTQVEQSARLHGTVDYNYEFISITHETLDDDGTYITISGVVTYADSSNVQYCGNYSIVLAPKEEEDSYVTKIWELDHLTTADGTTLDYYNILYKYIVQVGEYDSSDKLSYLYKQAAANETLYWIAEDNVLRYWYFVNYETSSSNFSISYECSFSKTERPEFEFQYIDAEQIRNGIPTSWESATLSGYHSDVLGESTTLTSEDYRDCSKYDMLNEIHSLHSDGIEFIKEIMSDAGIHCSVETLFDF